MTDDTARLPFEERRTEDVPGHWLLARIGKRVLRPGGAELTRAMLDQAGLGGADVVELAPGLGWTAAEILAAGPQSYTGVDQDADAARIVARAVAGRGRCLQGDAAATGLPAGSADVVVGEAMLTMQSDRGKQAIITEAVRLLRPGGRYAIHELGLRSVPTEPGSATAARQELARSIKVNARPLPITEWQGLLEEAGLVVDWVGTAPMSLLSLRRNLADEGVRGTARILRNVLRDREVRSRVLAMRATFRRQRDSLVGVAFVAHLPVSPVEAQEDPR
ncbi:MAG TPA: methyltransferase domain-containing protein [Cellulomonas sp.]